mmetsp:Transcript_107745/g.300288  ORF Transcript_107745/g.300288 Transcript_107745/m.300288 type:complete len:356 (-) Transcript_107745:86-1153(-)
MALLALRWLLQLAVTFRSAASRIGSTAAGQAELAAALEPRAQPGHDRGKYAFVTMAHDPPGTTLRNLWGALAAASALQRLSVHPLVLLTNLSHFPDGTSVADRLGSLNVQVLPLQHVPVPVALLREDHYLPCAERNPPVCGFQFLKLQVWRLTQFEKLIWMDTDAILTRSVDWLFERKGVWAQQDNWDCGSWVSFLARTNPTLTHIVDALQRRLWGTPRQQRQSDSLCSGMMLLEPSEGTYQELVRFMSTLNSAPGGDQEIIARFFTEVKREPVHLLNVSTASFGQCIGKGIPGGVIPALVHKSGWENSCFQFGADEATCSRHPLGKYWHNHLCAAISLTGISASALGRPCSPWG